MKDNFFWRMVPCRVWFNIHLQQKS